MFGKIVDVITHYDELINENNDPCRDPLPLKEYMEKWDGPLFIESMRLSNEKSVLEIGVGTGRIAEKVAPLCSKFCGIDISPLTIIRAKENLFKFNNVKLICANFTEYNFKEKFDIIYSSLTLMHFDDKQAFISKVSALLKNNGRFCLSIDKSQQEHIDMGNRKLKIYPDSPCNIVSYINLTDMHIEHRFETEFSYIFVCIKN